MYMHLISLNSASKKTDTSISLSKFVENEDLAEKKREYKGD